jgi:hypothetical protein
VTVQVPASLKLEDLQQVYQLAKKMAQAMADRAGVPDEFKTHPINTVGHQALLLVANTMPDDRAAGQEGKIMVSLLAAFGFIRQLLDRVGSSVLMDRQEYIQSLLAFCHKYGPLFTEAVRARLPHLLMQAQVSQPVDLKRAQRLQTLCNVVTQVFDLLPSIMGEAGYEIWRQGPKPKVEAAVESPKAKEEEVKAEEIEVEAKAKVKEEEEAEVSEPEETQSDRQSPDVSDYEFNVSDFEESTQ